MSQTKVKSGLLNFPDQTDFVKLPSGTTAQRPSSPEEGYSRYNTTDNKLEFWNGTIWQQLPGLVPPTIESVSYPGDDLAADPAGGQTITLTGTNFLVGASVEIDGTIASVVTVVSETEITFTAPAKAAGDYDIVLTNGDSTTATFVDGMTYNGLPSWTTPAGNLGTFAAGSTIPTITLVATEPDSGVVSYSVTTGALPTGLTLTGADIDGTVPSPAGQTTYNFSVTASDDENQESTERAFNIVVYLQVTNTVDEVDPFGNSSGVALYQLNNSSYAGAHRYWKYTVGSSTNHHPRVSKIYLIKSDGSKENFVSFTSDNCNDVGTIPTQGTVYSIDLGSADQATGSGFYVTYGGGERNINYTLSYSDNNVDWTVAGYHYVNANACGEWNNTIGISEDESGNYDGVASNVTYGAGVFGQAGVFNGSRIEANNVTGFPSGNAARSVSVWVKMASAPITGAIVMWGTGASNQAFVLYPNYTELAIATYGAPVPTGYNFTLNQWTHIVVTHDGTTTKIYADNVLVYSFAYTYNTATNSFVIGNVAWGEEPFHGSIDQVRVFNTALNPLEVESLYRERTVICGGQADTLDILGDNSCIATYQLNGNANDLSGNYSATPINLSYGVGKFDLAGIFDSSTNYALLPFNLQSTPFSISFWAKDNSGSAYNIANGSGSTQNGWMVTAGVGSYTFRLNQGSTNYFILNTVNVVDQTQWHHVLVTWDNTTNANGAKIYINGSLDNQATSTGTSNFTFTNSDITIFKEPSRNAWYGNGGKLDQIRFFNKALSAGEVTTLYNETACDALACGGTTNTLDILSDGSCVAAYPLDGSPLDLSGNHHGTIVGQLSFPPNGKFDQGISPTETSYITVPPSIYNGNSGTSISLWFKSNGVNYTTPFWAVGPGPAFEAGGWQIRTGLNGTGLVFTFSSPSSGDIIGVDISTTNLNNGEWHHVVGSWDGTTSSGGATFYLNNTLVKTSASSGNLSSYTFVNNNYIGVDRQSPGRACTGGVDQVRIFNKALSAGEVTTLYNETACN